MVATSGLQGLVPVPAYQAGFKTNTFTSTFQNDVDLAKSLVTGKKWYPYNAFGSNPDMSKVTGTTTGGPLILTGDVTGPNGQIVTAAVKAGNPALNGGNAFNTLVGTAFGGGGYFEATLLFDPATVVGGFGSGWPSFWSLPIEKFLGPTNAFLNNHWPTQSANWEIYVEPDFFEYLKGGASNPAFYGGTSHNWDGIFPTPYTNVDNTTGSGNVMPISDVNLFKSYNKFGCLWIPATSTSKGSLQMYLNRIPLGSPITWSQFLPNTHVPPVAGQPWAMGILDYQHLSVILGTGPNANMTVLDVNVWQKNASNNLVA